MTTIEMLSELMKNGGMFEREKHYIVAYDPAIGVCAVTSDNAFISAVTLYGDVMKATWKPYVKPVDWSKVAIDTKVLCVSKGGECSKRHFAGIVNGIPTAWQQGKTSWTTAKNEMASTWHEIRLAEGAE